MRSRYLSNVKFLTPLDEVNDLINSLTLLKKLGSFWGKIISQRLSGFCVVFPLALMILTRRTTYTRISTVQVGIVLIVIVIIASQR